MTELRSHIAGLQRPRLLIQAARLGLPDYRRDRDLRRLIGALAAPPPAVSVTRLLQAEDQIEAGRRAGAAGYNAVRHVDLLIALMAEARLLPRGAGP
ncbi:MAG: hypothetical protein RLZZ413_1414 [Pseudomonadota bacterium]|jgi:hypothetical protein